MKICLVTTCYKLPVDLFSAFIKRNYDYADNIIICGDIETDVFSKIKTIPYPLPDNKIFNLGFSICIKLDI